MMELYGQDTLQLVYSYVKNKEIAEDLTQEISLNVIKTSINLTARPN